MINSRSRRFRNREALCENNYEYYDKLLMRNLEGLMKDQPLPTDASPTALSPGYIANFDLEEDKEDPEEDPADHPADG
ncbi:hypothetical protein Tco_1408105 [Tanacetum coccineum]